MAGVSKRLMTIASSIVNRKLILVIDASRTSFVDLESDVRLSSNLQKCMIIIVIMIIVIIILVRILVFKVCFGPCRF